MKKITFLFLLIVNLFMLPISYADSPTKQNIEVSETKDDIQLIVKIILVNKKQPYDIISTPGLLVKYGEESMIEEGVTIHCFGLSSSKDDEDHKKSTAFWKKIEKERMKQPSGLTLRMVFNKKEGKLKLTQWFDTVTDINIPFEQWVSLGYLTVSKKEECSLFSTKISKLKLIWGQRGSEMGRKSSF